MSADYAYDVEKTKEFIKNVSIEVLKIYWWWEGGSLMPSFNNLKDLENYLKKNPEIVLEQNIGKVIEYECPKCKTVEKIKITLIIK